MSSPTVTPLRIAAVQMNTRNNKQANVETALRLIDEAATGGARLIALPEVWTYMGPDDQAFANAEPIPGPTIALLQDRARQHRVYIHAGSIAERSGDDGRLLNTTVVIDPTGDIVARYSKLHMFDVELAGGESYKESATITPGNEIVTVEVDGVQVGLAICYDLRFPELFRILTLKGAEVIFLPAAFTMTTGKDHWEVLIRARAIENGVYMAAPGQFGQHPPGNWSYGRSIIVDPWGTVLATAADGEGVIYGDVSPERVQKIRGQVPSLANRRPDAYHWPDAAELPKPETAGVR